MEEQFLEIVAEALEEEAALSLDNSLEDLDGWDSLGALTLLSMIDDEYGVIIGNTDLEKMVTLRDMFDFINSQTDA